MQLTYPEGTLQALSELLDADRQVPMDSLLRHAKLKLDIKPEEGHNWPTIIHRMEEERHERLALVFAWEGAAGRSLPPGYSVVLLDGDKSNLRQENMYCMPRHELAEWLGYVRVPIEIEVDRLEQEIMAIHTSEDVKNKLLGLLDQLVDPTKPPDIVRQRAICETVQALVGVLKVEVAYIRAVDGGDSFGFLEDARHEAQKRRDSARDPLLAGPATNHPWRGLGSRGKG